MCYLYIMSNYFKINKLDMCKIKIFDQKKKINS